MPTKKKPTAKKPSSTAKVARKPAATRSSKKAPARKMAARADYGAPVDGWFEKQPEPHKTILAMLRELVQEAAPDTKGSLKWGQPFYEVGGGMMCALTSHKAHVNLVLTGPDSIFDDPKGLLDGASKLGSHIKLRKVEDVPKPEIRRWLKAAAAHARERGKMR
jgi:hypothetical protein